jgi:hypothetical protein
MDPIRINIPPTKKAADDAAGIVMAAIAEAGLDQIKAFLNPMVRAAAIEWRDGRWTRQQFIDNCRKLLILNPGLAARTGGK